MNKEEIINEIKKQCTKYTMPVEFALTICNIESGFNATARSPSPYSSAMGLYQLVHMTWLHFADEGDSIYDPIAQIKNGLRNLNESYVYANKFLERNCELWELYLCEMLGIPSFKKIISASDASDTPLSFFLSNRVIEANKWGNVTLLAFKNKAKQLCIDKFVRG